MVEFINDNINKLLTEVNGRPSDPRFAGSMSFVKFPTMAGRVPGEAATGNGRLAT